VPKRIRPARRAAGDVVSEQEAERELRGMEIRVPRPFTESATDARRAAQERYRKGFFHLLNRLRAEGRPSAEVLEQMREFRAKQHPAPLARPTITEDR
jgi:hypothetical protein